MNKALIILSGGQDSTLCAVLAKQQFDEVHAITFAYSQRHNMELASATAIAEALQLTSHVVVDLCSVLLSKSPLISDNPVEKYNSIKEIPEGIEPTFIPGRNILFLTIAANRAAMMNINDLFIGVCETDFAGYWDCRKRFIDSMKVALGEGIHGDAEAFKIHTPLMKLNKKDSVLLAKELLGIRFEEIFAMTHTCYDGIKGGCGHCHACLLRDRGFHEANIPDPIWQFNSNRRVANL
jgi:7-cyano-7-deazaguanine synthase